MILNELLTELIDCWQRRSTEILRLESAFLITKKYCEQIRNACWASDFSSDDEEIYFFRHIQPQFCGRLMYYSILYEALISAPAEKDLEADYWQKESQRLHRFTQKNQGFIDYLDSGAADRDAAYFLRSRYLQPSFMHGKIFQCGPDDITLQASVSCSLFAERNYHVYVQSRLNCFLVS
jgi:hypothetical protein